MCVAILKMKCNPELDLGLISHLLASVGANKEETENV